VQAATSGPWWSARNFPCWPALDDWFTAANLIYALARPGHQLSFTVAGWTTAPDCNRPVSVGSQSAGRDPK
jgi:hypothetical protein